MNNLSLTQVFTCCLGPFFLGWVAGKTQLIVRRAFEVATD